MWSQLRRRFTPGFESLLDHGVHQGWYDIDNTLQRMIFRWIFIPWLQEELDSYRDRVNHTAKRRDRNKVHPHGVAELIFDSPQDYGTLDLKFMVDRAALKHVRELYVDANHPVFDLVPRALIAHLEECYNILGRPAITRFTVWDVYLHLLHAVQDRALLPSLSVSLSADTEANDSLPLLDGQRDLPLHETNDGYYYMGGVGGGLGLDESTLGAIKRSWSVFPDEIHVRHLNDLDDAENEPDVIGGPDVVVTEFSDEEGVDNEDDWG